MANHYGIGAKVDMEYGGDKSLRQTKELQLGGGFMSFDTPQLHFGLGPHTVADRATIRWPDGSTTILEGPLRANRRYMVHREATSAGR